MPQSSVDQVTVERLCLCDRPFAVCNHVVGPFVLNFFLAAQLHPKGKFSFIMSEIECCLVLLKTSVTCFIHCASHCLLSHLWAIM